jgi:hypothetical protein
MKWGDTKQGIVGRLYQSAVARAGCSCLTLTGYNSADSPGILAREVPCLAIISVIENLRIALLRFAWTSRPIFVVAMLWVVNLLVK